MVMVSVLCECAIFGFLGCQLGLGEFVSLFLRGGETIDGESQALDLARIMLMHQPHSSERQCKAYGDEALYADYAGYG